MWSRTTEVVCCKVSSAIRCSCDPTHGSRWSQDDFRNSVWMFKELFSWLFYFLQRHHSKRLNMGQAGVPQGPGRNGRTTSHHGCGFRAPSGERSDLRTLCTWLSGESSSSSSTSFSLLLLKIEPLHDYKLAGQDMVDFIQSLSKPLLILVM